MSSLKRRGGVRFLSPLARLGARFDSPLDTHAKNGARHHTRVPTSHWSLGASGAFALGSLLWASAGEAQNLEPELPCDMSAIQTAMNGVSVSDPREQVLITSAVDDGVACVITGTLPPDPTKPRPPEPLARRNLVAFQLRVPDSWNRKFFFQGGAGLDGYLPSAKGSKLGGAGEALDSGYAVISTNGGHFAFENCKGPLNSLDDFISCFRNDIFNDPFALYSEFGLDPQARLDYGYKAIELVTKVGKRIVSRFYGGANIAKSYFVGCSNGGRQAMMAAKRLPDQYDGILAGAPAINITKMVWQAAFDTREAAQFSDYPGAAFTDSEMRHVRDKVIEACDSLDGVVDQMVGDPVACQSVFNPSTLTQPSSILWGGLRADKVASLTRMLGGVQVEGAPVYASWMWDPGLASNMLTGASWRTWRMESVLGAVDGGKPYPIMTTVGGGAISYVVASPPVPELMRPRTPPEMWDYLKTVNIGAGVSNTYYSGDATYAATHYLYDVPSPQVLDQFAGRGKLLVFSGSSDGAVATNDLIRWYDQLKSEDTRNGRKTDDYARFYVIPGMGHCGAGRGTDQFDLFQVLEQWVEAKTAPAAANSDWDRSWRGKGWGYAITTPIATVASNNLDAPSEWRGTRKRPLCPYPMVAKYGWWFGPKDSAASFTCKLPNQ